MFISLYVKRSGATRKRVRAAGMNLRRSTGESYKALVRFGETAKQLESAPVASACLRGRSDRLQAARRTQQQLVHGRRGEQRAGQPSLSFSLHGTTRPLGNSRRRARSRAQDVEAR
jgi:hypothetical protein